MPRVIGEDKKQFFHTTCNNCAAILEYTRSEVEHNTYKDISGCSDTVSFIKCPRCSSKCYVKDRFL